MKALVHTLYLSEIRKLANRFAYSRSLNFSKTIRKKVYRSTYKVYTNLALYFYLELYKTTYNRINFDFNHISCKRLKKFSCKLYHKIIVDLEKNQILKVNHHYSDISNNIFTKSFLLHRIILSKIEDSKRKFKFTFKEIEVPEKVMAIGNFTSFDNPISSSRKLNKLYRRENQERENYNYYYDCLDFNENSLFNFYNKDEFLYNIAYRKLTRLCLPPKYIKGRYYHVFHELGKDFREKVLTLDKERIVEVFDVSGSDLHMLAKLIEYENIPEQEILNFQQDVKNDFRKLFGVKKSGKCKENVKLAFKVYLNSKKSAYSRFRSGSICSRINEYFLMKYPNIRKFIISRDNLWKDMMEREFKVISENMFGILKMKGIKALTCHDAIYVKESDVKKVNYKEIFYKALMLKTDMMDALEAI